MKKLINTKRFIIGLIFIANLAYGQSDPKLSNYIFTPITNNPAYAGSYEGLSINSYYTSQWVGFEGAPKTIFMSGHNMMGESNVGLGFDVMNDQIGATNDFRFNGNFSYHLRLSYDWTLSAGIKAGLSSYTIDYNRLSVENPEEFNTDLGKVSNLNPLIGAGFYVHNEDFFFGFSVPNFLITRYFNEVRNSLANTTPNFFIGSGYSFNVKNDINIQPSVMTRIAKGAPLSILSSVNFNWKETLYTSINFEANVSIGGFVGFRFLENFMLGYAYDSALGRFSRFNGGIHSLTLNFRASQYTVRRRCGCYTF